jgi:hypothetical protein
MAKSYQELFAQYEEAVSDVAEFKHNLEMAEDWRNELKTQLMQALNIREPQTVLISPAVEHPPAAVVNAPRPPRRSKKRRPRSEVAQHVQEAVGAIKAAGKPLDAAALAKALNCDEAAARNRLQRGVSRGVLTRVKRGLYDAVA